MQGRGITRRADPDGMGTLKVFSTLQDIATIHTALTAMSEASRTPDDDRTTDNRKVDALVDVCADVLHTGVWHDKELPTRQRRRPHVHVTMPLTALLDGPPTGEVAQLAGYGPITPAQARQIAVPNTLPPSPATLRRLFCDPLSGTLLDYGRTTYEPPAALADHVIARDQTCRMPGCRQPAWRCDGPHRWIAPTPNPTPASGNHPTTPQRHLPRPKTPTHHRSDPGDAGLAGAADQESGWSG